MQGVPALRQAIAAKYAHYSRRHLRPRHRGDRDLRRHRGDLRRGRVGGASRRRGHRPRALLRLVRAVDRAERRRAGRRCRCACRTTASTGTRSAAAITPRTRLLMINSPHNPTGSILTAADIAALIDIVRRTGIYIVSDEVYEHIIFDGARHESMARHPELAARSFVVGSFGKTYHVTGWKVGYVVAPAALTRSCARCTSTSRSARRRRCSTRIAEFLDGADRPRRAAGLLPAQARPVPPADGGIPVRAAALPWQLFPADGLFGDQRSARCRVRDLDDAASTASRRFPPRRCCIRPAPRVVRFCFAKKDETLERAAERLRRV